MSGSGEREGRSSRRPSPLRATVPLQAMHRTSPLRLRNRISPDTEITPSLDLSTATPTKGRVWSGRSSSQGGEGSALMRRTASLDAIYLKGQWPKDTHTPPPFSNLLSVDKASQTPEEWASTCYGSLSLGFTSSEEAASTCSSGSSSRRPSASVASTPWLTAPQQPSPTSGEQIDKFIRHRLARGSKEGGGGGGPRCSPVHGDHSVLAPTPLHPRHHALQHPNGGSRAISIPQLPKPLLPPRLRSSVEGLNQEIERLVLRPIHVHSDDLDDALDSGRDGRRAPIADYLRFTRSVDTQTPARGSSSARSSTHTSPSLSPPTSPKVSHYAHHAAQMPSTTPSPTHGPPLATSPHINKFLAREPPDGCEKVALKLREDRCGGDTGEVWASVRPPPAFTLRPSQGSAFCAPDRSASDICRSPDAATCHHHTRDSSEPCPMCGGSGSPGDASPPGLVPRACHPPSPLAYEAGLSSLAPPHAPVVRASPEVTADQ